MIEHAPSVRLHKKRVTARARKECEIRWSDQVKYWEDAKRRETERVHKLQLENQDLRAAVKALTRLKEGE